MTDRHVCRALVALVALMAPFSRAFASPGSTAIRGLLAPAAGRRSSGSPLLTLDEAAARQLGAARGQVVVEDFPLADGTSATFALERFGVLAPGARVVATDGVVEWPLALPATAFFQGAAVDDPDKQLVLGLVEGRELRAIVRASGAVISTVEPALSGGHQLLGPDAIRPVAGGEFCGTRSGPTSTPAARAAEGAQARATSTDILEVELLVDVGYDVSANYFGGDTGAAGSYAQGVIAAVSAIYQRDLRLVPKIVALHVWTSPEPFVGSDTNHQVENYNLYNRFGPDNPRDARDVALYLAGNPNEGGQTIVGVACNTGVDGGVVNLQGPGESGRGLFPLDVEVAGHELGHTVGSPHTHCYDPPIDHCVNDEAGCYAGPIESQVGETMSYCAHGNETGLHCANNTVQTCSLGADCGGSKCEGTGFHMGFGDRVRQTIRAFTESHACFGVKAPACGDGVLDTGEACDDGNTAGGDCCAANCQSALPCQPAPAGRSRIKVYRRTPRGHLVAHAARVYFAPAQEPSTPESPPVYAPTSDWLAHGARVRPFYHQGDFACVQGTTLSGRTVYGWIRRQDISSGRLAYSLPDPPPDAARRICLQSALPTCENGCVESRRDTRPGQAACGAGEPDVNPCFTTSVCTVRSSTFLLLDPAQPDQVVHTKKKKLYCTGPVVHTCADDGDCSGGQCREVGIARWSRFRLGSGRRVGLTSAFTGAPAGPSFFHGTDRWVWVAAFPPRPVYRKVTSGWVLRRDLCCADDPDNDPSCPPAAAAVAPAMSARAAAMCTVSCCDGTGATFPADDAQDCRDRAEENDVCERGMCDVSQLDFDGATILSQPCKECCALCHNRTAYHLVIGGCEDCPTAATDYCAVGSRGSLVDAAERPLGSCIEDPPGDCLATCCDSSTIHFPAGSQNECRLAGEDPELCPSPGGCGSLGTMTFNGRKILENVCSCGASTTSSTVTTTSTSTSTSTTAPARLTCCIAPAHPYLPALGVLPSGAVGCEEMQFNTQDFCENTLGGTYFDDRCPASCGTPGGCCSHAYSTEQIVGVFDYALPSFQTLCEGLAFGTFTPGTCP